MSTKHAVRDLYLKVWDDFIIPSLADDSIRETARYLNFGDTLTKKEADKLYNFIIVDLIDRIKTFLKSDTARRIYKDADFISAGATFSVPISNQLDSRIITLFTVTPPNQSFLERIQRTFQF